MYFKAEYKNISFLGEYLVAVANDYNEDIEAMIKDLEELGKYWNGPDYENYKKSYKSYLQNIKTTYVELNAFGNALKKVANLYGDIDVKFDSTVKKIEVENGNRNS